MRSSLEIGFDPLEQAQNALYYSLSSLATGQEFPAPDADYRKSMRQSLGGVADSSASDGIVPTLSQPWGSCVAVARADHLDIIGHHGGGEGDTVKHYDWLSTRSNFREPDFHAVWSSVVEFIASSEE